MYSAVWIQESKEDFLVRNYDFLYGDYDFGAVCFFVWTQDWTKHLARLL